MIFISVQGLFFLKSLLKIPKELRNIAKYLDLSGGGESIETLAYNLPLVSPPAEVPLSN